MATHENTQTWIASLRFAKTTRKQGVFVKNEATAEWQLAQLHFPNKYEIRQDKQSALYMNMTKNILFKKLELGGDPETV